MMVMDISDRILLSGEGQAPPVGEAVSYDGQLFRVDRVLQLGGVWWALGRPL